jgi:hypothetical protein
MLSTRGKEQSWRIRKVGGIIQPEVKDPSTTNSDVLGWKTEITLHQHFQALRQIR